MAFEKKTWKDRLVEYAGRRKITNTTTLAAQIVDMERAEGIVSEEGSAFNAANMNDLEQRVADGFSGVQQDINKVNQNLGGFEFSVSADGTPMYKPGGADSALPFKSAITYQKKLGYFSTTFTIPAGVKKCGLIWGGHTQTGTAVNISVTGAKISEHIPIWTALYFWTKLSILEVEEESIKCTVSGADRTSDCLMILLY